MTEALRRSGVRSGREGKREGKVGEKEEWRKRRKSISRYQGIVISTFELSSSRFIHSFLVRLLYLIPSTSPFLVRSHCGASPACFSPCLLTSSLSIMDVVAAVSSYITKMVTAGDSPGSSSSKMKILLLDSETVGCALLASWFMR